MPTESGLEIVDQALALWLARIEPGATAIAAASSAGVLGRSALMGLGQSLPGLAELLRTLPDDGLRVIFSPEVRKGLVDGTYQLMSKGSHQIATAVDSSGRTVEHAVVAGTVGGAGAVAAGVTVWPVVLAAGVATAAAMAEHRWLDQAFGEVHQSLARIETRLRDDDLGRLIAVDNLVGLIGEDVWFGEIPEQLRTEIVYARQDVDAIFWSRRRFVERFAAELSELQARHEAKTGRREAWAGDRAVEIVEEAGDELVVFLASLITRGRITAVAASLLARDGAVAPALRMLDGLTDSTRTGYFDLYNRVKALDRADPTAPTWRKLIGPLSNKGEEAVATVHQLATVMDRNIGERLPERDALLELPVAPDRT